eukprot:COSAG01_NODE_5017_length_4524_cov_3.064836_6_plen_53_part_00
MDREVARVKREAQKLFVELSLETSTAAAAGATRSPRQKAGERAVFLHLRGLT